MAGDAHPIAASQVRQRLHVLRDLGADACIRGQALGFDGADGALLIDVRGIATDADGADHQARLITNQYPARRRYHAALPQAVECADEGRALLGIQRQQARTLAQGDRPPGLADGDLRAQQASAILPLQGHQMTTGIEYRDGQWRGTDLAPRLDGLVGQVDCDFQG